MKNLINQFKGNKAVNEYGITEIFVMDGEVYITSNYDVPADWRADIEKTALEITQRPETESRVNGIINLRALALASLTSQRNKAGRMFSEHSKANEGIFINRLLYPVHFPGFNPGI